MKLISRYAEEVRRMLELEFFRVDITSNEIRIIASEKPLNENSLADILDSDLFKKSKMEIPYAVGYDMLGAMVIADIAEFPHLLIGGTSNSGKSSAVHSLLMSIVYKQPADKVKLLLMDFGASKLKMFRGVPHNLMCVFEGQDRKGMIADIKNVIPHIQDSDMVELAGQVLGKLETMSDAEFAEVALEAAE